MTKSFHITLSSPNRVEESSEKLQIPVSSFCSFKESSEPKLAVLDLSGKSRKRKACPPLQKEIGGCKRLKQSEKSLSYSLESVLKGDLLSGDQLKKKKMLEMSISVGDGERISLSRYLHENGFSYESQSAMVSIKKVETYMISCLVSLFFRESENPLKDSLEGELLRRISNRWGFLQNIVEDIVPKITAEEATLNLLKNQGVAYESLIVFLDLFERRACSNREDCERKRGTQKYEDIKYPFLETQFVRDVLEVAKGGHLGLKKFVEIFRTPSSKETSEWEKMKASVWERMEEASSYSEEVLLDHVRKCLKAKGGAKNKQALMDCLMNSDLELDGKKGTFLNFLRSEYGANLSTVDAMHLLVKCIGVDSGSKNKQAFVECLTRPEIDFGIKKVSLYTFLKLEAGLSTSDAIHLLAKCVGGHGASKNKQAFVKCLSQPEVNLGSEKVSLYTFLKLEAGLGASDAMHLLVRIIGIDGGAKNKQAFMECLRKEEIDLDGKKVPLYAFLTSKQGGGLKSIEAIEIIVKFVANCGGSKNKQAFVECISQVERDLEDETVYSFLNSKCGLSATETIDIIVKCIGTDGGCKNKQALIECISKQEIFCDGEKVSLYHFLISKKGGGVSIKKAIHILSKCVSSKGGSKSKQALVDCFVKPEMDLDGERVSLYTFLCSKKGGGLSAYGAIHVIVKCTSSGGGEKNRQALVDCFSKLDLDLDGRKVSLYTFLISQKGVGLTTFEALHVISRCIGLEGGSKSKQALMECLTKLDVNLAGRSVSLYRFLCSKQGGGFRPFATIHLLVKCIGFGGGAKNKQAFLECFNKKDLVLNGEKVSLYEFLKSKQGGELSLVEAIQAIVKLVGTNGGSKNKQAFIECLSKPDMNLDGKRVSLYTFLVSKQGGGLSRYGAIQMIVKCLGFSGGSQNKQVLMDIFCKLEINLDGRSVSLLKFLISKQGGGLSHDEARQVIVKVVGNNGGSKNKQAFVECLNNPDIKMNGKFVPLYTFLSSKQGGTFNSYEAIQLLTRCVGCGGGANNLEVLKEYFNKKLADIGTCKKSLYELFLSANLTVKEAISLCLIFSVNRYVLNVKDIFCLFDSKEKGNSTNSVIGMLNSLSISCYATLLKLVTKVLNYPNIDTESKNRFFTSNCQSLVSMFLSKESYFNQKIHGDPNWAEPDLARRCIDACILYTGTNINHELMEREKVVIDWIRSYADGYRLTENSLAVITSVQSLNDLKLLIDLCDVAIEKDTKKGGDSIYCEERLMDSLQILIGCKQSVKQVILRYKSILLGWFDLKFLSYLVNNRLRNIKVDKLIEYFFEKRREMECLLPSKNLKKSFLIYMKLSSLTPFLLQPLKLENIQSFFESIGEESVKELIKKNSTEVYSLYAIYASLDLLGKKSWFHEMMEGLPKIFMSYTQFRRRYQYKIQKTDWALLSSLIQKWNLEKDNVSQEELSFLIRIGYQLPKDIVMAWSNLSRLENSEKGCCVLNRTRYPNWVFALSYFQKVSSYLSEEFAVIKQKDGIVFESYDITDFKKYSFPLFKIELHEDGFVFNGESVKSVACFYAQSGLDDCFSIIETDVTKTTEDQNLNPSSDERARGVKETEFQKKSEASKEAPVSEKKNRKRKGANIETECQQSKEIRLFSRQDIYNLYETVSRQSILTERNCEIFLQGACYLSETMLDVLMKKTLVVEMRNKEIQEKWQAFVDRYEKQKTEKGFEMFENSQLELDEDLTSLISDEIKDEAIDYLPSITFDALYEFLEEVCSHEF